MALQLQIIADDFTKTVGQHHAAVAPSLFSGPHQAGYKIDIIDIQIDQRSGSKAECAQQHDNNKVSQPYDGMGFIAEVSDQAVQFIVCKKLGYRFFDFGIRQTGGDIFRHDSVQCQKMVKLPERPDPGLYDVYGWGIEFGRKIDQIPKSDLFNRLNFK